MASTLRAADKLAELKEFDRIINLALDAHADLFVALEVPHHFRKENQPCPIPLPDDFEIDFERNYYRDMLSSLHHLARPETIEKIWENRWRKLSPVADIDEFSYRHLEEPTARYQRKKEFERICTAYNVLRDPVLRAKYDAGRIRLATAAIPSRKVAKQLDIERKTAAQERKGKTYDLYKPKDDMHVTTIHIAKRMYDEMNSANDMVPMENEPILPNETLLESGTPSTTPLNSDDQSLCLPIHGRLSNNTPNERAEDDTPPEMTSPRKRLKLYDGHNIEPTTPETDYPLPPKELTREEIIMRNLADLKAQMVQGSEQAEKAGQNASNEVEKYIYVKDMNARRYVRVLCEK